MNRRFIALIGVICLIVTQAFASGWPQPKRGGYFKLGQNWIISDAFYSPSGDITTIRTNSFFTTSLYAEYGWTDRFTTTLYLPFFVSSSLAEVRFRQSGGVEPSETLNSIGDTDIGFKYGLIVGKPVVLSGSIILGLPLGETSGGASGILQTGDGEFNQQIRLDASHSFYPRPFYASAYGAFNNRNEGFSDEIRGGAEVGYTSKRIVAIAKLSVVESLFNGSDNVASNGVFSNNTEFVSPSIELAYLFKKGLGVSVSYATAFSGRNILASPSLGVGVFYKLTPAGN
jgi:protein XagA